MDSNSLLQTRWVYKETSDLENIDFGLRTALPAGSPLSRALFIKFTREFNPFQ